MTKTTTAEPSSAEHLRKKFKKKKVRASSKEHISQSTPESKSTASPISKGCQQKKNFVTQSNREEQYVSNDKKVSAQETAAEIFKKKKKTKKRELTVAEVKVPSMDNLIPYAMDAEKPKGKTKKLSLPDSSCAGAENDEALQTPTRTSGDRSKKEQKKRKQLEGGSLLHLGVGTRSPLSQADTSIKKKKKRRSMPDDASISRSEGNEAALKSKGADISSDTQAGRKMTNKKKKSSICTEKHDEQHDACHIRTAPLEVAENKSAKKLKRRKSGGAENQACQASPIGSEVMNVSTKKKTAEKDEAVPHAEALPTKATQPVQSHRRRAMPSTLVRTSPAELRTACMPFPTTQERSWYCCELFSSGGCRVPDLAFESCPVDGRACSGAAEADTAMKALQDLEEQMGDGSAFALEYRSIISASDPVAKNTEHFKVRMQWCPQFHYTLPMLQPHELQYICGVETRLQAARFDLGRCVPVFWDTETTGFYSPLWWEATHNRIVQIGAVGGTVGGPAFKVNINPFPVEVEEGAARKTGLSTAKVWANFVPPQVGLAQFLEFCLRISDAHDGAVPVLVAHNCYFDCKMLMGNCWQCGLSVPSQWRALCTYELAVQMRPRPPKLNQVYPTTLENLARHFGSQIKHKDLHDALADARQLPIITAGLQGRDYGGAQWAVEVVARNPRPVAGQARKPIVTSIAYMAAARHQEMLTII